MKLLLLVPLICASAATAKPRVVTTLPSLAAIAHEVGGDLVEVRALLGPGQDPHYADPRPSLVVELAQAELLIHNGLSLEDSWLAPLVVQSRNARIQPGQRGALDASTTQTTILDRHQRVDRSQGDVHPGGNPHFLYDPNAAAELALAIGERIAALVPASADAVRTNAKHVATKYRAFAEEQRARFATIVNRRVITYHSSLSYLTRWLDLVESEHIEAKPGVAPSPQHTARVLQTMKSQSVRVVLHERYYPTRISQTLAKLASARLVVVDGGADFSAGQTYLQHVQKIADALHGALTP